MITDIEPKNFNEKFQAIGCYIEHDGKILFLKRNEAGVGFGQWNVPGGTVNESEDVIAAIIREVHEEIGVALDEDKIEYITKTYCIYPEYRFIYHLTKYKVDRKPKIKMNDEHTEFMWLTPQEALKLDLIPDEDYCIKKAFGIDES